MKGRGRGPGKKAKDVIRESLFVKRKSEHVFPNNE